MAMTARPVLTELTTMSRRSGLIMDADQAPLQSWIASQNSRTISRRPVAKSLSSLKNIPYTATEWKRALAEVKRDYSNKRYRPCSSRCIEILKNAQTHVCYRAHEIVVTSISSSNTIAGESPACVLDISPLLRGDIPRDAGAQPARRLSLPS